MAALYQGCGYASFARKPATSTSYFYERGCQMLQTPNGHPGLHHLQQLAQGGVRQGLARRYFADKHSPLLLLELGKDVFESAIVDSGVLMLRSGGHRQAVPGSGHGPGRSPKRRFQTALAELWGQVRPEGDAPWSRIMS